MAEYVVTHARYKYGRAKTMPSLSYGNEKNPRKALKIAEEDLKIAGIANHYKKVISEGLSAFLSLKENKDLEKEMKIGDFECKIWCEKGEVDSVLFFKEGSEVKSYIDFSLLNLLSVFKKDVFDITLHNSLYGEFEIEARHYGPSILSDVIFQYKFDGEEGLSQKQIYNYSRKMVVFCWAGSRAKGLQLGDLSRACVDFNESNIIKIDLGPKKHSFVNYYASEGYKINDKDFDFENYGDKVPPAIKNGDDFFGFPIKMKIDFLEKAKKIITESGLPELAETCSLLKINR
jgi:hypothetical protein